MLGQMNLFLSSWILLDIPVLSFYPPLCLHVSVYLGAVSLGVLSVASPTMCTLMHMWPLVSQRDCVLFACLKKGLGK